MLQVCTLGANYRLSLLGRPKATGAIVENKTDIMMGICHNKVLTFEGSIHDAYSIRSGTSLAI